MEIELKPCPFCGSCEDVSLYRVYSRRYGGAWFVSVTCELCGARSKAFKTSKEADDEDFWESEACERAAARWNKRAGADDA